VIVTYAISANHLDSHLLLVLHNISVCGKVYRYFLAQSNKHQISHLLPFTDMARRGRYMKYGSNYISCFSYLLDPIILFCGHCDILYFNGSSYSSCLWSIYISADPIFQLTITEYLCHKRLWVCSVCHHHNQFTSGFPWGSCCSIFSFLCSVLFVDNCLCFWPFMAIVFVYRSSIYGFWLSLWHRQTFLYTISEDSLDL
jgi:hypothetical protein